MKAALPLTVLLLGAGSFAHADTPDLLFATSSLYLQPDQTIDFLSAAWLITASRNADTFDPVDINGFTFTSPVDDDESDPVTLDQMPTSN